MKWTPNKLAKKFYIKYVIGACKRTCINCPFKHECYYELFTDFPTWKELKQTKDKDIFS